ncbi:MAG: hypothetical protein WC350_00480 [Candidatus Micrarchaeia archaeon]
MRKSKGKPKPKIQITRDGPYLVSGNVPLQKETIIPDRTGYPSMKQNNLRNFLE